MAFSYKTIETALKLLDGRLLLNGSKDFALAVCGGTALNALQLVERTTKDVDVVALLSIHHELVDPAPFPRELDIATHEVAETLNLPSNWLNNGPVAEMGDFFA